MKASAWRQICYIDQGAQAKKWPEVEGSISRHLFVKYLQIPTIPPSLYVSVKSVSIKRNGRRKLRNNKKTWIYLKSYSNLIFTDTTTFFQGRKWLHSAEREIDLWTLKNFNPLIWWINSRMIFFNMIFNNSKISIAR